MIFFIIISMSFFISKTLHAYPQFIGKGYHNCLTCHYNPFGNGPLNNYGRGVSASAIAAKSFFPKKVTDQELSNHSSFLFGKPSSTQRILPFVDYRGGILKVGLNEQEQVQKYIDMQLDAGVTMKLPKSKKFLATYTASIIPGESWTGGKGYETPAGETLIYSREHYLMYQFKSNMSAYLGKMDKVFGIRVPDHTAYSRNETSNSQYGATHGAVFHLQDKSYDLGVQAFIGDLEKMKEARSKGLSAKGEYSVNKNLRLGLSFLNETFETSKKMAYSVLAKSAIGNNSSLLFELGRVQETLSGLDPTTKQYLFLQNHLYITRGLYFLLTYEQYKPNLELETTNYRISPGLQYFAAQRIEFRMDLINSKEYALNTVSKDSWSFLGQMHLWF